MVYPVHTFHVVPCMPPRLKRLPDLAYNLRWAWDHDTIDLFRRLDHDLWETTMHNPVRLLGSVSQKRLEEVAADSSFVAHLDRVHRRLEKYMGCNSTWYNNAHGKDDVRMAYFCAEYAVTECLPFYSGGLGVLAGDHLKSASDLGLPLVGVGLLYQEGYYRQYINRDGWQGELYPSNDFHNMPVRPEMAPDGKPVTIEVAYAGRQVCAQVWRAQVGRVPLFLLNTNIPGNSKEDQDITKRLYPGDMDWRIRQEVMLGIGGLRALRAMGIRPTVCHFNEGHTAFAVLERIRLLMQEDGLTFAEAREVAAAGTVFTTHTPVPAGIDMFSPELVEKYLSDYCGCFGLSRQEFLSLGRQNPENDREPLSMAILALKLSSRSNGVSQLHGEVARRMWHNLWPGIPEAEVPIASVTNGVHHLSWISGHDVAPLLVRYLGERWLDDPTDQEVWHGVEHIPDEELWRTHERRRERLVAFARSRLQAQLEKRGAPAAEIALAGEVLDPAALTIGFGRRFATYKRATLLLRDPERLARILGDKQRPVQIIFAGKAHPDDIPGKELIRTIIHFARREEVCRRIVFLEDYDLVVARYMVQGADVWLNTARRLHEASGTSGMKAAANGAINVSVLDGWWAEVTQPEAGWTIGCGDESNNPERQDEVEAQDLYDLLEKEVVPLFYERGSDHLPRGWIGRMKASMRTVCPQFNAHRMVHEYCERFYLPAAQHQQRLSANAAACARELAQWKARLKRGWSEIQIASIEAGVNGQVGVKARVKVRAMVHLGTLAVEDATVELYYGPLDAEGQITAGQTVPMTHVRRNGQNGHLFEGSIMCDASGLHGYSLRILPRHNELCHPHELGLIHWAK